MLPFEGGCGDRELEGGEREEEGEPHSAWWQRRALTMQCECRSSCCCCPGRRVLTKVFTSSLVRKCRIHRIPLRVIYQIHIDPVPHPQPSPAAIMSLQDRFASQDPLSLLSGATTLSLITAASQASLAYNLPVVVCPSLCMPL